MHRKLSRLLKDAGFGGRTSPGQLDGIFKPEANGPQDSGIVPLIQEVSHNVEELTNAASTNSGSSNFDWANATQNTVAQTTTGGLLQSASAAGGGLLGGLFGFLPLISGIKSLFDGGPPKPEPLVKYAPPPSVSFDLAASNGTLSDAVNDATGQPRASSITELALAGLQRGNASPETPGNSSGGNGPPSAAPNSSAVTVQVNAMDSQSFLDRSHDIAMAVRHAMLNMHSINDVINDL